ncbi:ABC transporter permease subunit [Rhodobacter calidifons]|nr:hypothetical protein [Rhodobacter calidifons]
MLTGLDVAAQRGSVHAVPGENGAGTAVLRVPSMIFTPGMDRVLRGITVARTGDFEPQDQATPLMLALDVRAGVPILIAFLLFRTASGQAPHAIGTRERAACLSGIIGAFLAWSILAPLAEVLLAGCSAMACQGMGKTCLLPAIAAVVPGGTNLPGGSGRPVGTRIGGILIVPLNSALSIMQMPEALRQVICGVVITARLMIYGRGQRETA